MSADAIETVRAVYDAISRGDGPAIVARLAPEIVIEQTPDLPWGGRYEGLAGYAKFASILRSHIDSKVTVDRIFAAGEDVVVTGRTIGATKRNAVAFEVAIAHVLTVREGKVVRARYFIDTPAMLAALSAS